MGALAQLSQSRVEAEPGRTTTIAITVRNTGTVVDRYTFEALGAAEPWVTFSPDSLSLFPEASGTVNIILAPPRQPTVPAGPTPLGVRITSSEDPAGSVVEEATIDVGAFSDITLELVPRVTRGRIMGRSQLAVDNRSNCSYRARVEGTDPQMALQFRFRPPVVDVAPGHAQFVKVAMRPSSRFWKGPEKTRPFQLILRDEQAEPDQIGLLAGTLPPAGIAGVEFGDDAGGSNAGRAGTPASGPRSPAAGAPGSPSDGAASGPGTARVAVPVAEARPVGLAETVPSPHKAEISTDGAMLQEPLLPRWLLAAVGALIALAVLLAILWFSLFKPQVKSTAQNEVNKQLAANGITTVGSTNASKSGSGTSGSSPSGGAGSSGGSGANSGAGGAGSSTVLGGSTSGAGGAGLTVNGGVQATGNGTKVVFTVPSGRTLQVTDILVQNSAGAAGTLTLARSGTPVMSWSLANFRDLDYHWITPTVFGPNSQMQLVVADCSGTCTPGIYYAGRLVTG
jgi:hypothetical protein